MASYKDILEIANKRIDSGDIPDERVIFDIDSLGALTNDLAADSLLKRYPFDFPMTGAVKPGEIPLLSKILGFLELEDDPESQHGRCEQADVGIERDSVHYGVADLVAEEEIKGNRHYQDIAYIEPEIEEE